MNKIHIYLVLLLGVFLMPSTAMACGNSNSSKKSCSMEMTSKSDSKKSCCGTNSSSKNKKQKSCDGKCGHSLCTTSSVSLSFLPNSTFETLNSTFDFSSEKQKFNTSVAFTSDGYTSIWLIPKIG